MRRRTLASTLAVVLGAVLAGAPVIARSEDPDAVLREMARGLAQELAARGRPVDMDALRIESCSPDEFLELAREQQGVLNAPTFFDGMALLLSVLSDGGVAADEALWDGATLREQGALEAAAAMLAFYVPGEGRLAFRLAAADDLVAALSDRRTLVAHELVHAHQDQTRGILRLSATEPRTAESTMVLSCMLEGEAEVVSLSLTIDLATAPIETLAPDFEKMIVGEGISLPYSAGRTFMARRFKEGGWDAVAAAVGAPPPSTEQILHPEKLGRDVPTTVDLPPFPHPVLHEDVMGELTTFRLAALSCGDPQRARAVAAGWDGDRLRVHRAQDGETVVVWRSLWDREEDAAQVEEWLRECTSGTVRRHGRLVDLSRGSSDVLESAAARALEKHAEPPAVEEADARSAATIEAALDALRDAGLRADDGTWVHPESGTRIPIPDGWEPKEVRGMRVLADPDTAVRLAFASNINVQVVAMPRDADLDDLIDLNRAQLESLPGVELEMMERTTLGRTPAMHYRFRGRMGPGGRELVCRGAIFVAGEAQIVVTATTAIEAWDEQRASIERTFSGIRPKGDDTPVRNSEPPDEPPTDSE